MTTSIQPNLESRVAAFERQVTRLQQELERTRIAARIRRGLDQADRGLGIPLRQADEQLRHKYHIPRTPSR